jgi:hypothetical protein
MGYMVGDLEVQEAVVSTVLVVARKVEDMHVAAVAKAPSVVLHHSHS